MPTQPLSETTVVLNLELGRVSNRRKLDSDTDIIETDVDRNMLHLSVDLFDAAELRKCQGFLNSLKARIRALTVPSFLRGGMYLVKVEGVETVNAILEQAKDEFAPLVQAFADVVDERRDESKERLGRAYDPGQYPSRDNVLSAFSITWRWLALTTPSSLKKISQAFFDREAKKAEDSFRSAVDDINALLALEAKKLLDHMIDRLTPDEDGKPKIFRNSAISNLTSFLSNFSMRNIGTSDELNEYVERMRSLMEGVSPDDLRNSDRLREDMANGFAVVSEALDSLVMTRPNRFIDLKRSADA